MVDIFELKPLIETDYFPTIKYDSNHLFDIPLTPQWSSFIKMLESTYQKPFEDQ